MSPYCLGQYLSNLGLFTLLFYQNSLGYHLLEACRNRTDYNRKLPRALGAGETGRTQKKSSWRTEIILRCLVPEASVKSDPYPSLVDQEISKPLSVCSSISLISFYLLAESNDRVPCVLAPLTLSKRVFDIYSIVCMKQHNRCCFHWFPRNFYAISLHKKILCALTKNKQKTEKKLSRGSRFLRLTKYLAIHFYLYILISLSALLW